MRPRRSSAEKQLLAAVQRHMKRLRQKELRRRLAMHAQRDRLLRVSDRAHRRVVDGVLSRAGVDFTALQKRQKPIVTRMNRLAHDGWRQARAAASEMAPLHKEWILDRGRRIATFQENFPGIVTCLDLAVVEPAIHAISAPQPGYSLEAQSPGRNAINVLMRTGGHNDDGRVEEQMVVADFIFTTTCARDGLADASAFVFPNGAYLLNALSPWCHNRGFAQASLDCWITIAQPGVPPVQGYKTDRRLDVSVKKERDSDSTGEFETGGYSDMSTLSTYDLPVRAGEAILVMVTVAVSCSAGGPGKGTLDFATGPMEINVPGVCITVKQPGLIL